MTEFSKWCNTFRTKTNEGFKPPFRYDRNKNGGGILIYIRDGVPAKELKIYSVPDNIKCEFVGINLIIKHGFLQA